MTKYSFNKALVSIDRLTLEIQQSSIVTAVDHMDFTSPNLDVYFRATLSSPDETTLNSLVAAHSGLPLPQNVVQSVSVMTDATKVLSAGNIPQIEMALRRSDPGFINFTICTHDLSDRTTWYQKSIQVTNETLSDSGNGLLFNSAQAHWINMKSPKLTVDYKKVLERDGSLTNSSTRFVLIKSNGTSLVEGTDYTVDYPTGNVTFTASQTGNTITANYYHNNGVAHCSEFLFTPPPGFLYRVEHIESQFSRGSIFNDVVTVEIWAGAVSGGNTVNLAAYSGFVSFLYDAGYGQSRTYYRNMNDLLNWCNNQYPTIPSCGALTQDVMVFPFLYLVHPIISSKQGTTVRIYLANDIPITAEICTITLYMEKGPA